MKTTMTYFEEWRKKKKDLGFKTFSLLMPAELHKEVKEFVRLWIIKNPNHWITK